MASVAGSRWGRSSTISAHSTAAATVMGRGAEGIMMESTTTLHCSAASCGSGVTYQRETDISSSSSSSSNSSTGMTYPTCIRSSLLPESHAPVCKTAYVARKNDA